MFGRQTVLIFTCPYAQPLWYDANGDPHMPFTVRDFEDLVRLLYEHPEWRKRLRSVILPEEILTLPQLVRENSEAISRLEEAVAELVEAQKRTEEQLAASRAEFHEFRTSVDQRFAEARQHTDEQVASLRNWAEQRFERLESRVDNLYSEVGRLTNVIGASLEEEAQASVSTLVRQKGYKAPVEGYPVRLDGVGETDVVLPVESPEGEKLTVVAESKARLSRRAVIDRANRMASPDFRRRLKEAGVPGPYLAYTYAIRVDPASLDAAREVGIGVMSGRGILVEPREPLPEA